MSHLDTAVSLSDYWQMLDRHDWYFDYIDDYYSWSRANKEHEQLLSITKQSPEHDALYYAMKAHRFDRTGPLPPQPVAGPTTAQSLAATVGMFGLIMFSFFAWAYQ